MAEKSVVGKVVEKVTKKEFEKPKKSTLPYAGHVDVIEVGSPGHVALLSAGYNMSPEEAQQIITERDANPGMWSWEDYKKAKAMLKVLESPPVVTSERAGWKRTKH